MKKMIALIVLVLMYLATGLQAVPAVAPAPGGEDGIEVVKKLFNEAIAKEDIALLEKLVDPKPADLLKRYFGGLWKQFKDGKGSIEDIFGSGEKVAVRWTYRGVNRMLEDRWDVQFLFHFRVQQGKIVSLWIGDDALLQMVRHGFTLKPPAPKSLKGKLKVTSADISVIGLALNSYLEDHKKAPPAATIAKVAKLIQPFYIRTCPLKDAWGNDLLYKVDPKNPANYWVASPGSDGKFEGFAQKGTWHMAKEKGQDIILYNGKIIYGPELPKN